MTMVVYLADLRRHRTDSHGIINFSVGLTRALPSALGPDERLVVLANRAIADELGDGWQRQHDEVRILPEPGGVVRRLWSDHIGAVAAARAVGADVLLFPKGFLPLVPRRRAPGLVPCFHDDIPSRSWRDRRVAPRKRLRFAYFAFLTRASMFRADRRLFVSAFTADRLGARCGIRSGDMVVGEGLTIDPRPLVPLSERIPRALVFGSAHVHKATARGMALLHELGPVPGAVEQIVVVGHLPDVGVERIPVDHRPGPLDSAEVSTLLRTSRLLVFPSEYEGYGLPPVEAVASGTPTVFCENGVTPEVLPGVPGGFPSGADVEQFGRAIERALAQDDRELDRQSQRMRQLHDWTGVAGRVSAALRCLPGDDARSG